MHEILFTENLPTKLKFINQTLINRQQRRQKAKKLPPQVTNPKSPTKRSKSVYQKHPQMESHSTILDGNCESHGSMDSRSKSVVRRVTSKSKVDQIIINISNAEQNEDIIDKTYDQAVTLVKRKSQAFSEKTIEQ